MSESKAVITWTCSRCGATETVESSSQPKAWLRLHLASPPRRALDSITGSVDLCHDCDHEFARFVFGSDRWFPRDDLYRRIKAIHDTTSDDTFRQAYDVVLAIIDQHEPPVAALGDKP